MNVRTASHGKAFAGLVKPHHWHGYLFALIVSAFVLLLRAAFNNWSGNELQFVALVIPIVLSAYVGGMGPGLLCTALVALSVNYFLIPPSHSLRIETSTDLAQWLVLVLTGVLISLLFEELHRARRAVPDSPADTTSIATERIVQGGFAFTLACLGAIGVASLLTINSQRADTLWVRHTLEVINQIDQVNVNNLRAQNARRDYVVSGDEALLEPFNKLRNAIAADLRQLQALIVDNPEQQRRLMTLSKLINEELAFGSAIIALRREQGFAAVQALSRTGKGQQLHDQISAAVTQLRSTEQTLLAARGQRARATGKRMQIIITSGGLIAFIGIGAALLVIRRDFAQRRQVEAERDRFFNLSLDLQCVSSADGYFKRVNPAVAEILGWTPEEFQSRPFMEFVHRDDYLATQREVEAQLSAGKRVMQFENRVCHKDGSWRVLSWNSVPQGELMYAIARDITKRRQIELEIVRLNQDLQTRATQLEAVNQELESFSYSVSHDLRAPLRHVQGYVQLLTREAHGKLSDQAARYLQTIADAGQEMGQLIDNLLSFSRMGRAEMRTTELDLNEIVTTVRAELALTCQGRHIVWQIARLPAARGDPAMLKQVFANLLDNAVKYTRQRSTACIEVGCAGPDQQSGGLVFFVRDNGAGFDMQYGDKLFGVFQRLHRVDEFEGTGIGLANVRRIIMRHGGRTWAQGELDAGATFYFTLQPSAAAETAT